jgi:hypothetical protein
VVNKKRRGTLVPLFYLRDIYLYELQKNC